jgi:hypothetical protein
MLHCKSPVLSVLDLTLEYVKIKCAKRSKRALPTLQTPTV